MSSQEEQLIKSDTKHETCMFKNKMFLKMDKIVILRPCSASRNFSYHYNKKAMRLIFCMLLDIN